MTTLRGEFAVAAWDENAYLERDGERKLTRASVGQTFTGDLTGSGTVEWLMSYGEDGTARFVGLQHIESDADGRNGTVVVETAGDFDGQKAAGSWTVVPGSGTGDLEGMAGTGTFEAPLGGTPSYTLDATFG